MATGVDLYVDEAMGIVMGTYPKFYVKLEKEETYIIRGAIKAGIDAALYQQRLQLAHLVANADDVKSAAAGILTDGE